MLTTLIASQSVIPAKKRTPKIPKALVYEVIDGKEYYYKGYKNVLKNKLKAESVMGYGLFQWMIIDIIGTFLKSNLAPNYKVMGGEGGLHLSHGSNLSLDMIILDKKDIDYANIQNKYLDFAPKVVIEIDTKAEIPFEENDAEAFYYHLKTQKMLEFGVSQVVWVFTNTKKIMVAVQNQPWLTVNWTDEIEILGAKLNLDLLLKEEGFENY